MDVLVPNVGVIFASDVAVDVALLPVKPERVVVIVTVDEVLDPTPLTVTSPVALIVTVPLAVAVPE